jgi:hypothetical protein
MMPQSTGLCGRRKCRTFAAGRVARRKTAAFFQLDFAPWRIFVPET